MVHVIRRCHVLGLIAVLLGTGGCQSGGSCDADSACPGDAICSIEQACFNPVVTITSPASDPAYTNATLTLEATVQGGTPARLEFLLDGNSLALLTTPPFLTTWNTSAAFEGRHVLLARTLSLVKAGAYSPRLSVFVDRTPPALMSVSPRTNETYLDTLSFIFSEPILSSSVTTTSLSLSADGSAVAYTAALSADGTTLTVTPGSFARPATLEATLKGLTDLAGNSLPLTRLSWTAP